MPLWQAMEAYQNGMQDNANNPKLLQHIAWLRLQVRRTAHLHRHLYKYVTFM